MKKFEKGLGLFAICAARAGISFEEACKAFEFIRDLKKGNRIIAKQRRITRDVGYLFYRYPEILKTLERFDIFKRKRGFLKRYLEGIYA